MALEENSIPHSSHYIDMPKLEQIQPWYMRINFKGQVPSLRTPTGLTLIESRDILNWAYQSSESDEEKEILDHLYSDCPGSFAWLIGKQTIPLLNFIVSYVKPISIGIILPHVIRRYQSQNQDLYQVYEAKKKLLTNKHFTKSIEEVQAKIQNTVNYLEEKRQKSNGKWLLGSKFGRVDALCSVYLQWILSCNKYGAALINIPPGLLDYFQEPKSRTSYQKAIGRYGEDAFVLTMIRDKNRIVCQVLFAVATLSIVILGLFISRRNKEH